MTKVTKKKKGPGGRKRKRYNMDMKFLVCQWKIKDRMRPCDIQKKLKEQYSVVVSPGTLAGWYSPMMVKKFLEIAPDRLKVTDVRHNPKQRPDILVDMELILARKYDAVARHGIPYVYSIVRLIAIHIFNRLVASNVYGL